MGEAAPERRSDRQPSASSASQALQSDDLIDDRALTREDEDKFRLLDVVDEVARLCEFVPVPATVALYGSWGSGKSSLARLLWARFVRNPKIAFARFDAFKYAERPLRRHFISQLAAEFNVRDKAFSEGLYTTTRDFRLRIPPGKWWRLLLFLLVAVLVGFAITAVASLIYAGVAHGSFRRHFVSGLRVGIPGAAFAVPLLVAALGLLGNYFTAETTVEAPSSDEQFERVFRKLVRKIKKKRGRERIVVFIDELDRCSPGQVVSALETLRTFLEVRPCIFIVAADQQVLEHALTKAARQATPFNPANPYYSAGSAYLDKIFQYQLSLPPILPRRLSRFALDLIANRQGVWADVDNRADLVSVLVPTHVSSPRRVKVLLNSFALLYRLALRRSEEEAIEENIQSRATEVAKLACVRTEFPLFAADLRLDDRLPELVLRLYAQPDTPDEDLEREYLGLAPETLVRARAYARGDLPVDEVIVREPFRERRRMSTGDEAEDIEDETEPGEAAESASEAGRSAERVEKVERSHARQLIHYLQRTEGVAGPHRDLIYLESSGAAFGLPPELADRLERAAVDGGADVVGEAFAAMSDADQQNALRLLARLLYEAIGIEARNVAGSLFRSISQYDGDLTPVAAELLDALAKYTGDYSLAPEDLAGALLLALSDDGEAALRMRKEVLSRDEVLQDNELRALVLSRAGDLRENKGRVAEAFNAALSTEEAEEAPDEAGDAEASRGIEDAASERAETTLAAFADVPDAVVVEVIQAKPIQEEAIEGLSLFIVAAKDASRPAVAEAAYSRLVSLDAEAAGTAATKLISLFAPVDEPELASRLLNRARLRPAADWSTWLGAIDAPAVSSQTNASAVLNDYIARLWQERFSPPSGTPVDETLFEALSQEIGRLKAPLGVPAAEEPDLLEGEAPVLDPPSIAARE
jgi:hypothetical protein